MNEEKIIKINGKAYKGKVIGLIINGIGFLKDIENVITPENGVWVFETSDGERIYTNGSVRLSVLITGESVEGGE